jgi:hypothetical protein
MDDQLESVIIHLDIINCPCCTFKHINVEASSIPQVIDWYNYVALCPIKRQPIRIKISLE